MERLLLLGNWSTLGLEELAQVRGLQVAESNRNRICRVIRLRNMVEPEQRPDHLLHLMLFRSPIADNRLFYLIRSVLEHRQIGLRRDEQYHASRVPDRERRSRVLCKEQLLHRSHFRAVFPDQRAQFRVDPEQSKRQRGIRRSRNSPVCHETWIIILSAYEAVPAEGGAGINSQNEHNRFGETRYQARLATFRLPC